MISYHPYGVPTTPFRFSAGDLNTRLYVKQHYSVSIITPLPMTYGSAS